MKKTTMNHVTNSTNRNYNRGLIRAGKYVPAPAILSDAEQQLAAYRNKTAQLVDKVLRYERRPVFVAA